MTARRTFEVVVTGAIAVGGIGLISGVEGTSGRVVPASEPRATEPSRGARSYLDMQGSDYGPNRDLPAGWFDAVARPPTFEAAPTLADRDAALARRAATRAYDGAPPTIPHAVDQLATPACLTCHEHGARFAGKTAPVMPHARRDSCVQCHVVARDPRPVRDAPPAPENTFAGALPVRGDRAWPGAPPMIPHATTVRIRCDSCHGPYGALGLRPAHPWRSSCTQCHAPSAALDQRTAGQRAGDPR